ncbi:MAG: putative lipid II flippase FtsW [Candidatus Nanopelagicales bacterium]|jgi:cell division protein FtsW
MADTARRPRASREEAPPRRSLIHHPMGLYYLLLGAALALLGLGLLMVLSASSILSIKLYDSPYTLAQRQFLFAAIGVALMFIGARFPVHVWRKLAWPTLVGSLLLLGAVLVIGVEVSGQRNWIDIAGPFRLQPSEFAKIALVLWGADLLARKEPILDSWKHLLVPFLPVAGFIILLILAEGDVGNALLIAVIAAGMLFAVGAPLRLFVVLGMLGLLGLAALTMAAPYRMSRFTSWLDPSADRLGDGWQVTQGQFALGTGGWWGVGLGASREKWGSLPEAHTDFIFPVIGEELGLVGTIAVLALFAVIAFVAFRLVHSADDTFVRIASAGIGTWIVFQAVVNIGAVLSLLPITGVPLPLVSYGGSSLLPLLAAIGMLLSFARRAGATASGTKAEVVGLRVIDGARSQDSSA